MSASWGELPALANPEPSIAAVERDQMTKPRSLEVSGATLHQPSSTAQSPSSSESRPADPLTPDLLTPDLLTPDPLVLHTIQLLQYAQRLRSTIHSTQQLLDVSKWTDGERPSFPVAPPMPEQAVSRSKPYLQTRLVEAYLQPPVDRSGEARRVAPSVDIHSCHRLLRRSVATICAHVGYDACGESILETLTDVCGEYFLQMTDLLRRAVDNEALDGTSGFQDAVERVLVELGVGGRGALRDFYEARVVAYHARTRRLCEDLRDDYRRLSSPAVGQQARTQDREPRCDIQFPKIEDAQENGVDEQQMVQLEGLGLDASASHESHDDDSKWPQGVKADPTEARPASVDALDEASDGTNTPLTGGSETGESAPDTTPGVISPPASTLRLLAKPPKKRRRK